jgi:heptosyltransferase-2
MKIIFFSSDNIGDAILANIVLEIIAKEMPEIDIVVYNKNHNQTQALFAQNQNISSVNIISTKVFSRKFFIDIFNLWKKIFNKKKEKIYITSLIGTKTILITLLPIVYILNFFNRNIKIFGMNEYLNKSKKHIISHHIKQFETQFGVKLSSEVDVKFLQNFIGDIPKKQSKTIAILAGASNFEKTLPAEKFAKIIEHFAGDGFKIKLLGSKSAVDQHQANEIMRIINSRVAVENLAGKTDLKEYFSEIASAEYIITNDSSGQHIANTLGTPCGVLWARNRENSIVKAYAWKNAITTNIFPEKYKKCNICKFSIFKKPHCKKCIRVNYSKMDENDIILKVEQHLVNLKHLGKIS